MRPAEETVVRQCAPTLAGIKTGSLFPCPYQSRQQLLADIQRMNRVLVPRGLCLLPMRMGQEGRCCICTGPRPCAGTWGTIWPAVCCGRRGIPAAAAAGV